MLLSFPEGGLNQWASSLKTSLRRKKEETAFAHPHWKGSLRPQTLSLRVLTSVLFLQDGRPHSSTITFPRPVGLPAARRWPALCPSLLDHPVCVFHLFPLGTLTRSQPGSSEVPPTSQQSTRFPRRALCSLCRDMLAGRPGMPKIETKHCKDVPEGSWHSGRAGQT